jgi:hypothetical protein
MSGQREIDDRQLLTEAYSKFVQRRTTAASANLHLALNHRARHSNILDPHIQPSRIGWDDVGRFVSLFRRPY